MRRQSFKANKTNEKHRGERPEIAPALPREGLDALDEPVYWTLPDGRCVCKSARQLAVMNEYELEATNTIEMYLAVAKAYKYACLGEIPPDVVDAFLQDPGTLKEEKWKSMVVPHARWPEHEASKCWWLTNAFAPDEEEKPKLMPRSLTCLRIELGQHRVATARKLVREREQRQAQNEAAVRVNEEQGSLWLNAGGPRISSLFEPDEATMTEVEQTVAHLEEFVEDL